MTDYQDIEALNREYFNKLADQYDTQQWQKELSAGVTCEIQNNLSFILNEQQVDAKPSAASARRDFRLLDYACGTGMVTRALGSRCKEAVGLDISETMVERYKALSDSYPIPDLKTSSRVANLFADEPSPELKDEQFYDFDIAAVGLGFHHFKDLGLCIRRLAERLVPGGTILIIDFCDEGGNLPAKAGVTAHGFSESRMKEIFEAEGLDHVGYYRIPGDFKLKMHDNDEITKAVFLGRASKPA